MTGLGVNVVLDGPVGRLQINRPDRRNALDSSAFDALSAGFRLLHASADCRVIVISGVGDAFCSGWDVAEFPEMARLDSTALVMRFERNARLMQAIAECDKPTLAAIRGPCLGLGVGLAASADIAIASRTARFGLPELNHGVVPGMVMDVTMHAIGARRTMDWILSCRSYGASEALQAGLVGEVCDDDQFNGTVDRAALRLAALSPQAVTAAKSLGRRVAAGDATLNDVIAVSLESLASPRPGSAP